MSARISRVIDELSSRLEHGHATTILDGADRERCESDLKRLHELQVLAENPSTAPPTGMFVGYQRRADLLAIETRWGLNQFP